MSTLTDDRPRSDGKFPCWILGCPEPGLCGIQVGSLPLRHFCHAHYREVSGLKPEVQPEHIIAPTRLTDTEYMASYDSWLDKREAMGR